MSTENEIILKERILMLEANFAHLCTYLDSAMNAIKQNSTPQNNDFAMTFYNQAVVDVYLPFNFNFDTTVSVMVEESPGYFREATPIISSAGATMNLTFDRPQTGNVVVRDPSYSQVMNEIPLPPSFMDNGTLELILPPPETIPVIGLDEILAPKPLESGLTINNADKYEHAMNGMGKKWPR